jgi:N-acetylglucosaminyldiphosphoundecaprenol N-acetyl-beta-D-mannosaminyltransferase
LLVISRPPALLMGVPVDNLTMDESVHLVGALVDRGRATSRHHQIATVNLDFLTNAIEDQSVRQRLQDATVCLIDGTPPLWAAASLGMPLRERVAGSDLVPRLFAEAGAREWRIHCLGSSVEVAIQLEQLIATRHPAAMITVDPGPVIGPDGVATDDLIDGIVDLDPDILLVALGHPKQEHFIAMNGDRLGVPVMVGIGGTLDMMVGERERAPRWMQRSGLEWAYRAAQEPRRLVPRYLHDIRVAVPATIRQWAGSRRRRSDGRWVATFTDGAVRLGWTRSAADGVDVAWYGAVVNAIRDGAELTVAIGSGNPGDADVAQLVGLWRTCRLYDRVLSWETQGDHRLLERWGELGLPELWSV